MVNNNTSQSPENIIKIPAAERRGIFVLPESCTSGLIPPVTPQRGGVLNPAARIKVSELSIPYGITEYFLFVKL
ncbi:MAG: hypothetical protein Ta2B_27660 [Termitinemataceae bacterium]|nr:MAG: hypothetical protein Ta2B_27660 [Termitinemataceae bacterium]